MSRPDTATTRKRLSLKEVIETLDGWTNCHFMQGCPHDEEIEPVVEFLKALESSRISTGKDLAAKLIEVGEEADKSGSGGILQDEISELKERVEELEERVRSLRRQSFLLFIIALSAFLLVAMSF